MTTLLNDCRFCLGTFFFLSVAFVASLLLGRRAIRVDPMYALRYE